MAVSPVPAVTVPIEPSGANVIEASSPDRPESNAPGMAGTERSAGGSWGHTWPKRRPVTSMTCGLRLAQSHARSTVSVAGHGPAASVVSSRGPRSVTLPGAGSPTWHESLPQCDQRPKMSCVATEYRTTLLGSVPSIRYEPSDTERRCGSVVLTDAPIGCSATSLGRLSSRATDPAAGDTPRRASA